MQLNIDIEKMVADAITTKLAPEVLQPIIEMNVGEAVQQAIEGQFRYNSAFRQGLEQHMTAHMPKTFADMGYFGDFVSKAVVARLNAMMADQAAKVINPMLEEITRPLPAEMKIGELLQMVFDDFNDQVESYAEKYDAPTFIIRQSYPDSGALQGYMSVSIDPEENKSRHSCKYQLSFDGDGRITTIRVDDVKITEGLIAGRMFGISRLLLQLYAQQVRVIFDRTDFDGEFLYRDPDGYDD
ncbi:hypothetical protein BUE93_08625 [Chromobacterium amazonense]|uniref:Uncharacterized protein n=1 Tax=Chromobacterium amazonense TaxID=1382803 RepID=A0A2S9X5L2_9NEIS|nr:hypothetical protein [Chromobacterium amazonense]PRP71010.1 hypothetical protein BUE93_08625 [Chromobacterium amazonense]